MPKKETIRERLKEESIWIMLIIVFGAVLLWSVIEFSKEMDLLFNGVRVEAKYNDNSGMAEFKDKEGNTVRINMSYFAFTNAKKGDYYVLYYFPGNEKKAMALSSWQWWTVVFGITVFLITWSIVMLYKSFRYRRIKKQKFNYEKRQLSDEELGKIITEEFANHNRNLEEKHRENLKEETIRFSKHFSGERERIEKVIGEQERLWHVGTVYLGIILKESDKDGIVRVVFTDALKYLKQPQEFLKLVQSGDYKDIREIYEADTIMEKSKLPFGGTVNRFYYVVAKPGLCECAIMLPEWYYMREEIEGM